MKIINSVYSANDVSNLLELLNVNIDQIRNFICNEEEDLQSLKLAFEIYDIHSKKEIINKFDFSSVRILNKRNAENISMVCDILKLGAKHQFETQLSHVLDCVKKLDFNKEDQLLLHLQLVSTFLKHNGTQKMFDSSFIIFLRDIVATQNLKSTTNYFIRNVLKLYLQSNPAHKEAVLTEIITSLDLYSILCIIEEFPISIFTESFFHHLQNICYKRIDQWEYKLAVNIIKNYTKSIKNDDFCNIPVIIKGETTNCTIFQYQWESFFTLIEVSEEKQLHLVEPSLCLLKNIDKLAFIWTQCVFDKLLNHMQLSIVYKTASIILDLELIAIDDYRNCIKSLLLAINKNDFSEYAQHFFQKFEHYVLDVVPTRYSVILKESANINWTPLTAWLFYSRCTKRFASFILNLSDMENIKLILRNLEKLPHRYIRNGCFDLFYKKLKYCTSVITSDIFKIFKTYNDKYCIEAQNDSSLQNVETVNYRVEDTAHVLLNPDNYDESTIVSVYEFYNTFSDVKYSRKIMNFWKKRIENGNVAPKICEQFIEQLCNYNYSFNDLMYTDIETALDKMLSTQNRSLFERIYQSLGVLSFSPSELSEQIVIKWFRELENIKCYETRKLCTELYFEHLYDSFMDCWVENENVSTIILDGIDQNEQKMNGYLKCLPPCYYDDHFHYLLKGLYFGNGLTKQKKYEDEVCYQIFLEKGVLNSNTEPSLETTIRLEALKTCLYAVVKKPLLLSKLMEFSKKRYFPNSPDHIRYLRLTQTILILTKNQSFQTRELFDIILEKLMYESHQPSVRQMMQWILIRLCVKNEFCNALLNNFKTSMSDSTLTSLMVVLYHVGLMNRDILNSIIDVLLGYTMGAVFKLRVYSQVAIFNLISRRNLEEQYMALYNLLQKTLEDNKKAVNKVLNTDLDIFEVFDPVRHYHLKTILVDIPKLNNVVASEWRYIEHYLQNHPENIDNLLPMDSSKTEFLSISEGNNFLNNMDESENMDTDTANIQKKIVPAVDLPNNFKINTDLIVIASLVTSSANLGGLARTCEIYGVKKLIVHNVKVMNDKEFRSLSMSAEHWLNIVEVKSENLINYITEEKDKGYTVIGAEQTCDSVKLNEYKFPSKCILILGSEKQGIPFKLLPYLDVCLEIPQFGFVRSLNVHVAGSTFIWEYIKQISVS